MSTPTSGEFAHIGKSVLIKGELSGSEDIYVDGQVEGNIHLSGHNLTIGPHGRVRANVSAKNVTVAGTLDGNIVAGERTEFRKTAVANGDVQTKRIAIEDGAFFKGKLEILAESKHESSTGTGAVAASAASSGASSGSASEPKQ
jgi:cytoskeletal protein CcmA (bactofilin family)